MYKFVLKWYDFKHSFDELFEYGVNDGTFYPVDRDIWKIWYDYFKDVHIWEEAQQYVHPNKENNWSNRALERRDKLHIAHWYNARSELKALRHCEKRLTEMENKKS